MTTDPSPLAQVLVHLDTSSHCAQRLEFARAVAREHGAAVTALYAVTPSVVALPFPPGGGMPTAASPRDIDEDFRARARKVFDVAMKKDGPAVAWAESSEFPVVSSFVRQALYADLLVLGQHDSKGPNSGVPRDFVESVLADSGKPALVLPYEFALSAFGHTAVIAWKPTREAARAVTAALPFLQRASRVHVQSWGEREDSEIAGARLTLDHYLKLHGVDATWHRETGPEPEAIGDLLLSRCADFDADLLVMGCYGHGRAREWILGGATRTVLRSMTLPVLMSH
jgi:nucleotide-binding universal stress UspA family protein